MSYRYRKKRTGPIESVDEFLARGGQINTVKSDGRRYLSHEDRDGHDNYWDDEHEEFDPKNVPFDIRSKFYDTEEWKSLKYKFIKTKKTEELVCAQCGKGPFTKENWKDMNVDHIKPVKHFWEERLNMNNLQILCRICNRVKMNHYTEPFKLGDGAKSVLSRRDRARLKEKKE
jgi:5-methylcytosine-specific restriction endonuclease McrA